METPSPSVRRSAWVRSSWLTLEDSEHQVPHSPVADLHLSTAQEDEVFLGGCTTGKIENWLQGCGPDAALEDTRLDPSLTALESLLKTCNSFEDDLSLGAEATVLHHVDRPEEGCRPVLLPPPKSRQKPFATSTPQRQRLALPLFNMGHSMASSCPSSTATSKSASSISDVLQMCAEDAEETLYHLGFGCDEPQVTARIPARFFNFPSRLRGINFRLFLQSQLHRISQEDPNLSLASRFRQVEVLTAMANTLYSLYSHVSRTPLQKLAPPESSPSPAAEKRIGMRFFGSVRSEPRSPVERLKDTVSKMCLYTGSRTSDSTSPHNSPRKRGSIPEIATQFVNTETIVTAHSEFQDNKNDMRPLNMTACVTEVDLLAKAERNEHPTDSTDEEMTSHAGLNASEELPSTLSPHSSQALGASSGACRTKLTFSDTCLTLDCTSHSNVPEYSNELARQNLQADASEGSAEGPFPKVSHDVICPPIVEQVHQAPYCSPHDFRPIRSPWNGEHTPVDGSLIPTPEPKSWDTPEGDSTGSPQGGSGLGNAYGKTESTVSSPSLSTSALSSPCQILVTGWDEDPMQGEIAAAAAAAERGDPGCVQPPALLSSAWRSRKYLSPMQGAKQPRLPRKSLQTNSFELEEVHSAGEEECSAELRTRTSLALSSAGQNKSLPPRGDSFQSDSSGYVEDDLHPLA